MKKLKNKNEKKLKKGLGHSSPDSFTALSLALILFRASFTYERRGFTPSIDFLFLPSWYS